jgi:hypothetical protein
MSSIQDILVVLEPNARVLGGVVVLLSVLAIWLVNSGEWATLSIFDRKRDIGMDD